MDSLPVDNDAAPSNTKRRGPKPSSKKRLEDFRLRKSMEAQARIHREAFDETNISLDNLLLALNDLHLGSTPQVSEIPVTTRGLGNLTNECYSRAVAQVPRAESVCNVNELYRVSLAQHQLQLNNSQEHHIIPDPTISQIEVQDLSLDPALAQEVRGMDQNFAVVADLINATGVFEHHQQQFTPFIPKVVTEVSTSMTASTSKKRKTTDCTMIPDPYTVTFNNLRQTVEALSNPEVPRNIREYFKDNNSIPGAEFDENGLLLNPDVIMPRNYDRARLKKDLRAAEAYFGLLGSKLTSILGKCRFAGRGNASQLCGYYKELFRLEDGEVYSPAHSRIRYARPIEQAFMVRGALNLLGETPVDGLPRDQRHFAFREPISQVGYIDLDWSGLVTRCLQKR